MDEVVIVVKGILWFFGAATCTIGGATAISRLLKPFKDVKNKVDVHQEKIEDFESSLHMIEDSNKVICKSLLVLLNHEITGNGIDRLKEQRDSMEQFLINK